MKVVRSVTFCGTLFSLVILLLALSSQLELVLGQDESGQAVTSDSEISSTIVVSTSVSSQPDENEVVDQENQEEEACPCVEEGECPRKYGSDPLDFDMFGQLEPCKQRGFVRCCGVSVSVIQKTDETGVASKSDEDDETTSWESGNSEQEHESSMQENSSRHDNIQDSDDDLHKSQGHNNQDTEQEGHNSEHETEHNEQQKETINEKGDDDNIPAESSPNTQMIMMDSAHTSPKKRFKPSKRFTRFGRTGESSHENIVSAYDSPSSSSMRSDVSDYNSDASGGTSLRRKTFTPLRRFTLNPSPTSTPDNVDGGGSVVYSQRVTEFSPYQSRNNVNHNDDTVGSVVPATADGGGGGDNGDSSDKNVDASTVSSSLANGEHVRQRHPARRRRPSNQMRNRPYQHQQEQLKQEEDVEIPDSKSSVMDGEEEESIYGTDSDSGHNSPAPLDVPLQETPGVTESLPGVAHDEFDNNQRRPMSRLVKTRANGLNHGGRRRKPFKSDDSEDSSYPNNSNDPTPTIHAMDSGNEEQKQEGVSQEVKSPGLGSHPVYDDSAESKATIGSAEESEYNSAKHHQNSPNGKLMPIRPTIRPFNRATPSWSANAENTGYAEEIASNGGAGGVFQLNYDESKEEEDLSVTTSSSGLIKPVEQSIQQQQTNGVMNIRRIPIRRVQHQQPEPENIAEENGGGVVGGDVEDDVATTSPPVKGKIVMRRPINFPGKNNNNVPQRVTTLTQQLPAQVETEQNTQSAEKIEKLDVRARLRGRIRPNPLKASIPVSPTDGMEQLGDVSDANSEVSPSQDEPSRSPLLRHRARPLNSRPSILKGQSQNSPANEQSENYSNEFSTSDANLTTSDLTNNANDHNQIDRTRINKLRKGTMARLPLMRHNLNQTPEQPKVDSSDSIALSPVSAETTEAERPVLTLIQRQRQNRLSSKRGNVRPPAEGNGGTVAIATYANSGVAEDATISTSEAPVTVTSTYSRIRTNNNNKNSLLTRPIYRRPAYTTTLTPSSRDTPDEIPMQTSTTNSGKFGQRTRFIVPSKSDSPTEPPTLSINSDNGNESEKPGQSSSQLSEEKSSPASTSSEENSGGRRKVGFVRRKMVRVRAKDQPEEQQQQTEQQLLEEHQETKSGETYEQTVNNPTVPNSEHVASIVADVIAHQAEVQQQSPSTLSGNEDAVDDNDNSLSDHVKIAPVEAGQGVEEDESHAETETSDDGKQASVGDPDRDDSEGTENVATNEKPDGKYHQSNAGGAAGDRDSDTYDLILDQDVRKSLGTQNATHHTQNSGELLEYQSLPAHDAHLENSGGDNNVRYNNNHNLQQQQQQEHEQEDYYGSYYDSYNNNYSHDENDHKYSDGVIEDDYGGSAYYNRGNKQSDGIETLELGTPDYDPNPMEDSSQYYWQGYENLEDEEESRVHMKYLKNKSTPLTPSSSQSIGTSSSSGAPVREHSLRQNENTSSYNKGSRNGVGDSQRPQSPVNPHQSPFNAESTHKQPSSSNSDAKDDVETKRDKNSRIRQKLRRPPSAYINSSSASSTNDHIRAPTSAPFIPSLQSPRPTYSEQEALLESVQQSVQTLPPKQENPNSQQLEQFIRQNNRQVAPARNRSRVRVKLVTLKTTTPAPVVVSNNYKDAADENYSVATPDASFSDNEVKSSRPNSSKFTFPPYRKSALTLVPPASEATKPVKAESVSIYNPQRVVFKTVTSSPLPTTTTTIRTTTTTPAPKKPLRNSNYYSNYNANSYNGVSKGSNALQQSSNSEYVGSGDGAAAHGKDRLKVNVYNNRNQSSLVPSHSSYSSSPAESTRHTSPTTSPAPTTRKPQPRIKTPQSNSRLPHTTTTGSPVVIRHQLASITSAPLYSSNTERQSQRHNTHDTPIQPTYQTYQKPVSVTQQPEVPQDHEENTVSIRITSQDDFMMDHDISTNETLVEPYHYPTVDTRHQQQYQQEYTIKPPSSSYSQQPPPAPSVSYGVTQPTVNKNTGGKYTSRFTVPENFELPKPHLLTSKNNNADSDLEKTNVKSTYSSGKPRLPALPAPFLQPIKQQVHYQEEPDNNGQDFYDNFDPVYHDTRSPQHLNNQVAVEELRRPQQYQEELEVIPDIRINVAPPDQHPYFNVDNDDNYNNNKGSEFLNHIPQPPTVVHAVREPPPQSYKQQTHRPEPVQVDQYSFTPALKSSPYGPFPSTDHWSGIPTSNSPKLPEYFEENMVPNPPPTPIQSSFEYDNEIRGPPVVGFERRPQRPLMSPRPSGNDIRFVDEPNDEDNNVQSTVVQFGTDFGDDAYENEELSVKPQRPALQLDHSDLRLSQENEQLPFFTKGSTISGPNRLPSLPPPSQPNIHLMPAKENYEFIRPVEEIQEAHINNNFLSPLSSHNEQQPPQQLRNVYRAPASGQEPSSHGLSPNSVVGPPTPHVNTVSIEIKESELATPHFPFPNTNDDMPMNPPQQQHIIQLPLVPQQQLTIHHQSNMRPPPPIMIESYKPENLLLQPPMHTQNSQLLPEPNPNIRVQVDGRLHDEPVVNQTPGQLPKPFNRHVGNNVLTIENEPETKVLAHPPPSPPSLNPNFPGFKLEGHSITPSTRDKPNFPNILHHPQHEPVSSIDQPPKPGIKFPEVVMQGFGEQFPSRPGQFGPPPPGQQRPSQYVPFNSPQPVRGQRNESTELHQRFPVLPPPPQTYQNPFKFNGGPNQPYPSPQQASSPPYRQNFNGNLRPPTAQNQPFNHHRRPQQTQMAMRMPNGIQHSQFGNNGHFPPQQYHPRLRNPGMRTSRAANFSVEEEKNDPKSISSGLVDNPEKTGETYVSQSVDQQEQAILEVPTSQNNTHPTEFQQQSQPTESSRVAPSAQPMQQEAASSSNNLGSMELPSSEASTGQQHELSFTKNLTEQLSHVEDNKEQRVGKSVSKADVVLQSTPRRSQMTNSENFVQDEIPEESSPDPVFADQDISNLQHTMSVSSLGEQENQVDEEDGRVDDNIDNPVLLNSGKQTKMQEQVERQHKLKLMTEKRQVGRLAKQSSASPTIELARSGGIGEKITLSASKKSIVKIKSSGKDKNEQLSKETTNKNGKDQHNHRGNQNAGDSDSQDFVAPKVIQRGFYPILPYSEQDPGPILVQMLPKVEKFLPPSSLFPKTTTMINRDSSTSAENSILAPVSPSIGPQGVMMMGPGSLNQDLKLFPNKHVSSGNLPVAVSQPNILNTQSTVLVNNQAPFKSFSHNNLA